MQHKNTKEKLLGLLAFMEDEFISLKHAIEDNNKNEPYNLKHITEYLDIWYADLWYLSIDGIRYYMHSPQFIHALLDALFYTETEGVPHE